MAVVHSQRRTRAL